MLIEDGMPYDDFNLRYYYIHVGKKHRMKGASIKGSINYLLNTFVAYDYTRKKLMNYLGCESTSDISVKKLIITIRLNLKL